MAAYTFFSLFLAIRNAVKYKSFQSPVYSAAKTISLAAAAVSVLILENAMLTTFGQQSSEAFHQIMLGATGISVVLTVQGLSIYMLVNANRNRRSHHDRHK